MDSGVAKDAGVHDAGAVLDSGAKDAGVAPDLSVAHDLGMAPDLGVAPDLSMAIDLGGPPDLTPGPDLAGSSVYSATNPLQVDLSSILNVDTVASSAPNGTSYPPLVSMDGSGYDFMTESVAESNFDTGAGLPEDGFFAADADHPNAQLVFNDTAATPNSVILNSPPSPVLSTTFPIVNTQFSALQLYCTSTEGSSAVTITLSYSDSTTDVSGFTVPDWFNWSSAVAPVFIVQSGLSRFSNNGEDFEEGAALYGASVVVNPAKTLTNVTVATTSTSGRLVIYGATAY